MRGPHGRRAAIALATAVAALAAMPAAALAAATVTISGSGMNYVSTGAFTSNLVISGAATVADSGPTPDPITAILPCTGGGNTATCPGVTNISVRAGGGNDTVTLNSSVRGLLNGDDGNDVINGGPGPDSIRPGLGNDEVNAGAGNDSIISRSRQDPSRPVDPQDVNQVDQPDRIVCGDGTDTVDADALDDVAADCEVVFRNTASGAVVPGQPGQGTAAPGSSAPRPTSTRAPAGSGCPSLTDGAQGKNPIVGTSRSDRRNGTAQGDNVFGLAGNDILRGGGGDDCMFGGDGNDRVNGNAANDLVRGNAGNDRLAGGAGNDRHIGDEGNDRIDGSSGNDRLEGGAGADRLSGGSGRNTYLAGSGRDVINAVNRRRDAIDCGAGRDFVRADRADRVRGCERVRRVRR